MRNHLHSSKYLCAILILASCTEASPPAGDAGGGTDSGTFDSGAPRVDAGALDAGPGSDGGCVVDGCPEGEMCVEGSCVAAANCCTGTPCGFGFMCGEDCSCAPATGCCGAPDSCGRGGVCREDCTCGPIECVPDCEADEICEFGRCFPRCFEEGCPEGEYCSETGCAIPACLDEDCLALSPPLFCDPGVGCYDPCDAATIAACGSIGAECVLGTCVDRSCREVPAGCEFRPDCCGHYVCMPADALDPECPPRCGMAEPTPDPGLCLCGAGRGDVDPGEPDMPPRGGEPGGGGGEDPRGGGYCLDLRRGSGGSAPPFPVDPEPDPAF
jgi:hypothetical protein